MSTMLHSPMAGEAERPPGLWARIASAPSRWLAARRRRKARPAPVLAGYETAGVMRRHRHKWAWLFGFLSFLYAFMFALIGKFLPLQFMAPLVVMAMLVIWLLPDTERVPDKLLQRLLVLFLFSMLCWPDYLALSLPGLPWITAIRLTEVPMFFLLLICISQSQKFRSDMAETLNAQPGIWKMHVAFMVLACLSVGFSTDVGGSINKLIVALLGWTLVFFVSVYTFRTEGLAARFPYMVWGIAMFVSLIGLQEWRHSVVPWAGRIPSFLTVQDEAVMRILAGSSRAGTDIYRVQSIFTTPLGLAEFLGLASPFILHVCINGERRLTRFAAGLSVLFIFWTIVHTDSRLGIIGFFMAMLLYLGGWAALRWRRDKDSIMGPAITLTYPVTLALFMALTFVSGRLRGMVWGNGSQASSDNARQVQYELGMILVGKRPWGYGIGRGGETLGYTNAAGVLTIDTYYLSIALEFGIIGFFLYYGMVLAGGIAAIKGVMQSRSRDTEVLLPCGIALMIFFVIKSVFSQQESHPFIFMILGMIVALSWRIRQSHAAKTALNYDTFGAHAMRQIEQK